MSHFPSPVTCEQFEANVSDYVDRTLSADDRAVMDAHLAHCATCAALHADIAAIVTGAAELPALSPSHDLWAGIAERLDTPVVAIGTTGTYAVRSKRTVSVQMFAAAAMLIVAVSSGATYWFTRVHAGGQRTGPGASTSTTPASATQGGAAASVTATQPPPSVTGARVATIETGVERAPTQIPGAGERTRSRYASNDGSVELVYEREISAMRRIVDERLGDLDSTTVLVIENNLRIIDKAISDSRRALQNDPRSRFLSSQLDRALETKLGVLRRIALL